MNLYDLVESEAIREHLRKTGYEFDSLEASWLVWCNSRMTLSDKHNAWKYIINNMPDTEIEETDFESLHAFLAQYMAMEKKWLKEFLIQDKKSVFTYCGLKRDKEACSRDGYTVSYSSYKKCLGDIKRDIEDDEENNIRYIRFRKRELDENKGYDVTLDSLCRIVEIEPVHVDDVEFELWRCFRNLSFVFPTPFKRGDIVYSLTGSIDTSYGPVYVDGPVVIEKSEDAGEEGSTCEDDACSSMSVYLQMPNGQICLEKIWRNATLDYYPYVKEKMVFEKRILIILSRYLKGEIPVYIFSNEYMRIMAEQFAMNISMQNFISY